MVTVNPCLLGLSAITQPESPSSRPWKSRSSATRACRSPEWRSAFVQLKEQLQEVDFPITERQHDPDGLAASTLCPVHQADEEPQAQAGGDRLLIGCSGGQGL